MTRKLVIVIALALLPMFAASCKKAEEPQQPAIKKSAAKPEAAPAEPVDRAAEPESTADARVRNPFQSHLVVMKGVESPKKIKGPLECCELSTFRLIAVVAGVTEDEGFGLVQGPDGKRYVIRRGDVLGTREGKVVRVTPRSLIVREVSRNEDGKIVSSEDVELRLLEKQQK